MHCGREPVTASSAWREFTGKVGPLRQDWQDVEVFNINETSVQRRRCKGAVL
jgi:hypothetical protein